jgi:predicted DNA-binding transcriptional regulator AlpA
MDLKPILATMKSVEKIQGNILFYVRLLLERTMGEEIQLPEVWLTDQEVMQKLGISESTLYRRCKDKSLPYKVIKRKHYFKESDVLALLSLPATDNACRKPGRKRKS